MVGSLLLSNLRGNEIDVGCDKRQRIASYINLLRVVSVITVPSVVNMISVGDHPSGNRE